MQYNRKRQTLLLINGRAWTKMEKNMVKLDRIMLRTSVDFIDITNEKKFQAHYQGEVLTRRTYSQTSPCSVCVKIDYKQNWLLIEFTGKILLNDYPSLICSHTIRHCLEQINYLNVCTIDVDSILHNSEVTSCDITKDVYCDNTKDLTSSIASNLKNQKSYLCQQYMNGNVVISRNVVTKEYKKRLTIYDKQEELGKSSNLDFVGNISDNVLEQFKNTVRFELNLTSMSQIRRALHIRSTKLMEVLTADANPLMEFIDEILSDKVVPKGITTARDRERWAFLQSFDFDLKAVELEIRKYDKKWSRHIETYRALLQDVNLDTSPKIPK